MKVLSIDIGIKNLAICLFEKSSDDDHFHISKWDIINISEYNDALKCTCIDKNILCNKPAKFKKGELYYCTKHSKKQSYKVPSSEQKPSFITKQKISNLYDIANQYGILYEPKIKKPELISLINDHINKMYLQPIESKKANEVDLFSIGLNIKHKLNDVFKDELIIDYVIIENQIGPLAIRMKTIQGMIVQYFIMSNIEVNNIEFISASNKLKDCDIKDKEKYSDRKKLGIAKCVDILTSNIMFH